MSASFIHATMRRKWCGKKKKWISTWQATPLSWNKILERIAQSHLVMSMRFHSTTAAIACGAPVIDITHHDKNRRLLEELDLQAISADYWQLTGELLLEVTQNAENVGAYQDRLEDYREEAHARWRSFEEEWGNFLLEKVK